MLAVVLHTAHGVVVGIGVVVVAFLLRPGSWRRRRRAAALRRCVSSGDVVARAHQRAAAELGLTTGARPHGPAESRASVPGVPDTLLLAACTSVVAAVVHAAVGQEHFREGLRFGVFFVCLGAAQLAFAPLVVRRPTRGLVAAAAAANAGTVGLWVLSRTVGLPFGLAGVEPVGVLDVVASAAEIVLVGCCVAWLAATGALRARAAPASSRRVAGTRVLAAQRPSGV